MLADHLWFIPWHLIIVHWVIYLEKGILVRFSDDSLTSLVITEYLSKWIKMEYVLGNESNENDKNKIFVATGYWSPVPVKVKDRTELL